MDSGVRLRSGEPLQVKVVLRAQRVDFPSEEEGELFARVRAYGKEVVSMGFAEIAATATKVTDPADAERTLDTFYEVTFAKDVGDMESALPELKFAMALDKAVRK